MKEYRYQLEKYRGRGTRYNCPQCHRKQSFTRYIDTYNNNVYINDNVGKCNRLDKCGYHYTPRQYFEDHPWLNEEWEYGKYIGKFPNSHSHYKPQPTPAPQPKPLYLIPERVVVPTLGIATAHTRWLARLYGDDAAREVVERYSIGGCGEHTVFWQIDIKGRVRTGKCMLYDEATGKRCKSQGAVDWMHAIMRREGALPEEWELTQCLYGEHLIAKYPYATIAVVEAAKTAHVGAILIPTMVWVAVDSMMGLTAERLQPLRGRRVVLFPDQGRGFEEWSRRIEPIAKTVGFNYRISHFIQEHNCSSGADIADLMRNEK